mmetsp:Transcript_1197/g.2702  ORF Transcript_1197/g.2702 Transcript_1197/m.2702 type:complete len:94 (+) Transcript_1197:327-608(+)
MTITRPKTTTISWCTWMITMLSQPCTPLNIPKIYDNHCVAKSGFRHQDYEEISKKAPRPNRTKYSLIIEVSSRLLYSFPIITTAVVICTEVSL